MLDFNTRESSNLTQIHILKLQKKTKFYWSLIRLLVAFWCFKLHSQHDIIKATIFFLLIVFEFMTSKLKSRVQSHISIALIYFTKLWIGSQMKQNSLWLVPYSLFLQINLYMHGVPVIMLLGSTIVSLHFVSSIEASFYSNDFLMESEILKMMFASLFKGYQILSFNLLVGLVVIHYLYTNAFKKHSNTKIKLKEVQKKFTDTATKYKQMLNVLDETNKDFVHSKKQLEQTQLELEVTAKELNDLAELDELLIQGVSRKVLSPFDSLLGYIQSLSFGSLSPKSKEMLESSKLCAENILSAINNLIEILKLKSGRFELNQTTKEVKEFLSSFWKLASLKISTKGLQGALYISPHIPPKLVFDPQRVLQILRNIIDNAVKYTQKGSIKVFVSWIQIPGEDAQSLASPQLNVGPRISDIPSNVNENNPNQAFTIFKVYSSEKINTSQRFLPQSEGSLDNFIEDSFVQPLPNFKSNFLSNMESESYRKFGLYQTNFEEQFSLQVQKSFKKGANGFLKIDIDDTGSGIPLELQNRLFKPFIHEEITEIEDNKECGLGLFITKSLLDKMGGTISLISKENTGSRFCIQIPCMVAQDENPFEIDIFESELDIPNPIIMQESAKRALIVDDNPYTLTLLESFLHEMDIETETASDGLDGLEMFRTKGPGYYSIILSDIHMPIMDGTVMVKAIRKLEKERRMNKFIPVVIVTSTASKQEEKECLDVNGEIKANHLYKVPVSFVDFQIRIKALLKENSEMNI